MTPVLSRRFKISWESQSSMCIQSLRANVDCRRGFTAGNRQCPSHCTAAVRAAADVTLAAAASAYRHADWVWLVPFLQSFAYGRY